MMIMILLSYYIKDIKVVRKGIFKWTAKSYIKQEMLVDLPAELDTSDFRVIESRIRGAGFFWDVKVYPEDADKDTTYLVVEITEGWYITPSFNLYKDEEVGWVFGIGLNILNFLGRNYYLSGMYQFLGKEEYFFAFGKNWTRGSPFNFDIKVGRLTKPEVVQNFTLKRQYISTSFGLKIKKIFSPQFDIGYYDVKADTSGKTLSEDNNDVYLMGGVSLRVDTRDDFQNPTHGIKVFTGLYHFYGLQPQFNIENPFITFSIYRTIIPGDVLAFYIRYEGYFGEEIPAYLKYYIGGDFSVRGFKYGTLWGNHLLNARVEFRHTLIPLERRRLGPFKDALTGLFYYNYYDFGLIARDGFEDFLDFDYIDGTGFGVGAFLHFFLIGPELQRVNGEWKVSLCTGWRF